jgi:predicted dehydrogenase
VAGPSALHAPVIVACAERKIHVVSEKPIAITRAALNDIKQAVAKNGIHLSMLLPMRFEPPYLAMRQIVASGEIGEVAQIGAQKSYKLQERPEWMRNHATFGGIMPYIGIHMVDLMRFASGRELVEACSFQSRIGFDWLRDFENTSSTVFKLDNGGTAALRMDYLRPEISPTHGDDRLRLAGTKGVVEYQEAAGLSLVTDQKKLHKVDKLPPKQSLFVDFLQSLCGIKPHSLPLNDVYRVSEICLGARESAERHSIVKLI